jgi:hypothetical protein
MHPHPSFHRGTDEAATTAAGLASPDVSIRQVQWELQPPQGHLDHNDTSMGLALFVERYPGQARWWNFVFPRVHGTVIKLCPGTIKMGWARGAALYRNAPRWSWVW